MANVFFVSRSSYFFHKSILSQARSREFAMGGGGFFGSWKQQQTILTQIFIQNHVVTTSNSSRNHIRFLTNLRPNPNGRGYFRFLRTNRPQRSKKRFFLHTLQANKGVYLATGTWLRPIKGCTWLRYCLEQYLFND